jgi:hypothetical protein
MVKETTMATETQRYNNWLGASADHPRCVDARRMIEEAVSKETGIELVVGGDSFIVQTEDGEREVAFLFKAAANPETTDELMRAWVARKIDRLMLRKAKKTKTTGAKAAKVGGRTTNEST